jgi:hypothetical protein
MKLVFVEFTDDQDTVADRVREVCTGFLTDSITGDRWARPVGLAVSHDGSIYLTSDDQKEFVLKLERTAPSSVPEPRRGHSLLITPSPASESVTIRSATVHSAGIVSLYNASGHCVHTQRVDADALRSGCTIDTRAFVVGSYQCVVEHADAVDTASLVIQR